MRTIIRQSLKRAFVSVGKRSAIYVKRGQFFPPGVAAPPPCDRPAIPALLRCADEGIYLSDVFDRESDEQTRLWNIAYAALDACGNWDSPMTEQTYAAASLLASNADIEAGR